MIGRDPQQLHGLLRFGDARPADGQVVRRRRTERLVHQPRGEAVAVAGGQKDDVDLRPVGHGIDGVTAGADGLVIDVRRDDEDAIVAHRRLQMRILHLDVVLRRFQQ